MNKQKPLYLSAGKLAYLAKESVLLIVMIYMVMIGGTYNGMILYSLQFVNLILAAGFGLVGGGWLVWQVWRRNILLNTPLDLAIMLWLGFVALACVSSINPRLSWEAFSQYLILVLLLYLVVLLIRTGWSENLWMKTLLISSGVVIFLGLIELLIWYAGWFQIGGWDMLIPPATYRVRATLGHPNIAAAYLNLILGIALACLIKAASKVTRWILAFQVFLILVLVFFTSSRGGWIGTAAVIGSFGLFYGLDNWGKVKKAALWMRKRPIVLTVLLILSAAGLLLVAFLLYRQMQHPSHPGLRNPADARNYIWSVAISMFQQNPLVGLGPQTFGSQFIRTYSYPPSMLLAHSHNFFLNVLAEMGGLAAGAVVFLAVALFQAGLRRWRSCPGGERTLLSGILASLIGLTVHSQFDTPETVLLINLAAAVLIAMLLAPLTSSGLRAEKPGLKMTLGVLWIVGAVVFLGLQGFAFRAASLFDLGLKASGTDPQAAAGWIDGAAAKDPELAHYWFQSGMIHGELAFYAAGDRADITLPADNLLLRVLNQDDLALAVKAFQTGLAIDDSNAMHWANLGILQWSAGDREVGIHSLEHACSLANGSSVLQVLLGWMYEQNGQPAKMAAAYRNALGLSPELGETKFFTNSATRSGLVAQPASLFMGWGLLSSGDYIAAEKAFRNEAGLNNAPAYRGLGMALVGQQRYTEAEKALQTAEFIEPAQLETRAAFELLYTEMGLSEKSAEAREMVAILKRQPVNAGPLMQGDSDYAFYIYHRETLPVHLLGMAPIE